MRNAVIGLVVLILIVIGIVAYTQKNSLKSPLSTSVSPSPTQVPSPTSAEMAPSTASSSGTKSGVNGEKAVTVEGYEFKFEPSTLSFKKGEKIKLTFKNEGKYPHNLVISELNVATKTIQPNQSDTVEFTVSKTGTFSFVCTVDSHEQKGMKGSLTVQ